MTYQRDFPIGHRVVVHAADRREGSDHDSHGRAGTVVSHGMWFGVKLDKPPRYYRNPVMICPHNLKSSRDGETRYAK